VNHPSLTVVAEKGHYEMGTLWQDMKYGARMLIKNPGFTVVAVLTMALGIGANSAIFSVINTVLLRPLPYEDSERLMLFTEWSEQIPNMSFSVANFKDVRDQNSTFESLVAFRSNNYVLTGEGDPERLSGRQVTSGMFSTLRLQPILGRPFTAEEDKPGAERVVLLGEGFWIRRFGRDPNVLGKHLALNGEIYTVIGVLPSLMHGTWRQTGFSVEGRPEPPAGQMPSTDINRVSPDYFRAMGVRLLSGRFFTEQDHAMRRLSVS
jgi:putative ABC transport system permease protein